MSDASSDPLAEIVTLLQPAARFSKFVEGSGAWRMRREAMAEPFYCAVLDGNCRVTFGSGEAIALAAGDFVLAPAVYDMTIESSDAPPELAVSGPLQLGPGRFRLGDAEGAVTLRMRVGHCVFGAPDAGLLVPLLPDVVVVRAEPRLGILMQLVGDETQSHRPARDLVLERLLEVLLIEALRCGRATASAGQGLAAGLADERTAAALHAFHAQPHAGWTVADLAAEAALSRSAFFARFTRIVGLAPMEYVLRWRMAVAKRLLEDRDLGLDAVAERVGYGSASAFSVAFTRHLGVPPARYRTARKAG